VLRGLQHHADWLTYLDHRKREGLETSRVLAFAKDEKASYNYLRCDLTAAYGDKVRLYERHFVYLPDSDFLVVFDRVRAARPELSKSWLLHFQDRPSVDDAVPEPGISRFNGARIIGVTRRGELALGGRTVSYDGILFVHSLLPESRTVTIIGGPGFEYYNTFSGTNYPPAAGRANAPREAGAWRMELAPAKSTADDLFLTAFQIADGSAENKAGIRLLTDSDQKTAGVQFGALPAHQIVLFSSEPSGAPVSLPLRYEIDSPVSARHLLLELPPLEQVTIEINGKRAATSTVSSQGILSFEDPSKGRRVVAIKHLK